MGPRNQGKLVEWGICLGLGEHGDLIDRWGFHGGAYVREWHEHRVHIE